MGAYRLTYSMLGSGNVSIRAKSKLLAEEALFDMSFNDLVLYADFSDRLELMSIEKI